MSLKFLDNNINPTESPAAETAEVSSIYAFEFLNIGRVHYCRFELPNFCSHFMKNMFMITLSLSWFFYCFTEPDFILSGQHTYNEHRNSITHAKFSPSGHCIASGDIDGVIK